jgi:hypothetical protein
MHGSRTTHFSLSISAGATAGSARPASSAWSSASAVAVRETRPATRHGANGSRIARVNAGISIFFRVVALSDGARRPMRMHVFVRIDASPSPCIFARKRRRSLFWTRSLNCEEGRQRSVRRQG